MKKKIGVVILNYNDSETTKKLCVSIRGYDIIDHIAVVDNCSSDDSFAVLQSLADTKIDVINMDIEHLYGLPDSVGGL